MYIVADPSSTLGIQALNLGHSNFKYDEKGDKIDEYHYLFEVFLKI
jgi:hypothetical protein